ncbi:MAG: ATP-binding protein [Acidimicrobiales bacterium]
MPAIPLPRRLSEALGVSLVGDLTEQALAALVGLRESDDLEVKSAAYGNSESDRRELATDAAALANATGGLLLIGATETDDVVDELVPLRLAGEELRIRQILANLVAPALDVETIVVPSKHEVGKGYLAIVVGQSPSGPHAVLKNADLRFFKRDGPRKRPMSESEVADHYRGRFTAAASRVERLMAVHDNLRDLISPDTNRAWLLVSGLPEIPGRDRSSRAGLDELRSWMPSVVAHSPMPYFLQGATNFTTGFRRYVVGDWALDQRGAAEQVAVELHHDGAAGIAFAVGHDWNEQRRFRSSGDADDSDPALLTIGDEGLSFAVLTALGLVGAQAQRTHAGGQIEVAASFFSVHPVGLGHTRQYGIDDRLGNRSLAEFERLTHTLAVNDLAYPGPGLVAAGYLVASDLTAGFGLPETLQLDIEGHLKWRFINHTYRGDVGRWADLYDIPVDGRD